MARIPYIDEDNAPKEVAELFSKMKTRGADILNLWKMVAHSPSTLPHLVRMGNAIIGKTELNPKFREIAILLVAEILKCEYEKNAHTLLGKSAGLTDEQLASIKGWKTTNVFSPAEKAVLRYTDQITKKGKASKRSFSTLGRYFNHRKMMELTITMAYYGMLARLLLTFEVDFEDNQFTSPSQIMGRNIQ